jgi:hypothetical protein
MNPMQRDRVPEYGTYNTDGDLIEGALYGYRELAKRLGESNVGLYMKSEAGSVILGTAVNVQKAGRRPDTVIVIAEAPPAAAGNGAGSLITRFFAETERILENAGYELLNIGNDPEFRGTIALQGIAPAGEKERDAASCTAGRLIAGSAARLTSSRLIASATHIAHTADILQPVLHLGFSFAASRKTTDADLRITPEKAPDSRPVEISLDSKEISDPDASFFRPFSAYVSDPANRETLGNIGSRSELARTVADRLARTTRDPRLQDRYRAIARRPATEGSGDVQRAVRAVVADAGTDQLGRYLLGRNFNRELLRDEIFSLTAAEFRTFWERVAYSPLPKEAIIPIADLFTGYQRDLGLIGPALQEKTGKASQEARQVKRRRWPFLILLAMIAVVALYAGFMMLGGPGSGGGDDGDTAGGGINRTTISVRSDDSNALLTLTGSQAEAISPAPAVLVVIPPADFAHEENWKPVTSFYKIEPAGVIFDPPASLSITTDFSGVTFGDPFIAYRTVINTTISGPWIPLATTVVSNESIQAWIPESGLYGGFSLPEPGS